MDGSQRKRKNKGKGEKSPALQNNIMSKKKKKRIWNPLKKRVTVEILKTDIPKLEELAEADNRKLKPYLENEIKHLTQAKTD